MTLRDRVQARDCATENCERKTRPGLRYCTDCTVILMRTGRPPVLPVRPAWLRNLAAKDFTDRSAA